MNKTNQKSKSTNRRGKSVGPVKQAEADRKANKPPQTTAERAEARAAARAAGTVRGGKRRTRRTRK